MKPNPLTQSSKYFLLIFVFLLVATSAVQAHEVRPAYFELVEAPDSSIKLLWKQPLMDTLGVAITPRLSSGWLQSPPQAQWQTSTHRIQQWLVRTPHGAIVTQQLDIDGLEKTITNVLVRVRYANGSEITHVINPDYPQWLLPNAEKSGLPVAQYLQLGIEHIWSGIDHLLYVFALILLVRNWRLLLKTITAFTVAHSITLAAATLKIIPVSPSAVEAVIALSIVYVAAELIYARRGAISLALRAPWLIAFAFGLLHGFGFAGALAETGLPADNIPLALLLFNIGIEMGQLSFVAVVLGGLHLLQRTVPRVAHWSTYIAPHVIGSLATFWLIERTLVTFHVISH